MHSYVYQQEGGTKVLPILFLLNFYYLLFPALLSIGKKTSSLSLNIIPIPVLLRLKLCCVRLLKENCHP